MTEIAILHGQGGQERADAQGRDDEKQHNHRQQQDPPAGRPAAAAERVDPHEHTQHAQADEEVEQAGAGGADGDAHAREVDLGDQVLVADHALGGRADGVGEKGPGQKAGKDKQRVGDGRIRLGCHPRQEQREHRHGRQRLQDGPGGAENRLLVTDLDVAPDEEIQQFPVAPQFAKIDEVPAPFRFNDQDG